ncbi:MAG: type II toxin-antitoxin system RelE/ParE family toxin [Chloroflexi bacterium]|nr:type II toxin-antitoxin system RelE/ParE family toxin [Chloroflexota bacterium]MYD47959.1 type II toxin-antitoxin system RelE/ParE family toxin [Chloroflexota bacterium]
MIKSFKDSATESAFASHTVRQFSASLQRQAQRKLRIIDNATTLNDLRVPPGNRLERLSADRDGQHSIRINDQWRICFVWDDGDAWDVEIVDYH